MRKQVEFQMESMKYGSGQDCTQALLRSHSFALVVPSVAARPRAVSEKQTRENAVAIVGIALRAQGVTRTERFWRSPGLADQHHRVFLECAWEALEDGGCVPERYPGAIGMFAGRRMNTYFLNNASGERRATERFSSDDQAGRHSTRVGPLDDFPATPVSGETDLRGPTLQTGCSTPLLAVAQACRSLMLFQSDAALAGGFFVTQTQESGPLHQDGADGTCLSLDTAVDGAASGSNCQVVLLKRLEDAVARGDCIYAVIRGDDVSDDGAAEVDFSARGANAQAAIIMMALAAAGRERAASCFRPLR